MKLEERQRLLAQLGEAMGVSVAAAALPSELDDMRNHQLQHDLEAGSVKSGKSRRSSDGTGSHDGGSIAGDAPAGSAGPSARAKHGLFARLQARSSRLSPRQGPNRARTASHGSGTSALSPRRAARGTPVSSLAGASPGQNPSLPREWVARGGTPAPANGGGSPAATAATPAGSGPGATPDSAKFVADAPAGPPHLALGPAAGAGGSGRQDDEETPAGSRHVRFMEGPQRRQRGLTKQWDTVRARLRGLGGSASAGYTEWRWCTDQLSHSLSMPTVRYQAHTACDIEPA